MKSPQHDIADGDQKPAEAQHQPEAVGVLRPGHATHIHAEGPGHKGRRHSNVEMTVSADRLRLVVAAMRVLTSS